MQTRRTQTILSAAMFAAALAMAAPMAAATTLLEFDFRNVNESIVTATAVNPNNTAVSNTATVNPANVATGSYFKGNAEVKTVATGLGSGFASALTSGYLNITRTTTNGSYDCSGIQMRNTAVSPYSNAEYRDYQSGNAGYSSANYWGTSTLLFVYQPNFSGTAGTRHTLFAAGYSGTTTGGLMLYIDTGSKITMALGSGSGVRGSGSITVPSWDATKWYMIAASWTLSDEVTLYCREMAAAPGDSTGQFGSGTTLTAGSEIAREVSIGVRSDQSSKLIGENAEGKIAYFLWTDQYAGSATSFDSLFQSLYVPEPASVGVTGLVGAMLLLRRIRR